MNLTLSKLISNLCRTIRHGQTIEYVEWLPVILDFNSSRNILGQQHHDWNNSDDGSRGRFSHHGTLGFVFLTRLLTYRGV